MTKSQSQSKNWCFTLNNHTQEDYDNLKEVDCRYIVFGMETGESNTPHLQGYVCFNKNYRLAGLKKLHSRIHWESARGNHQQASDYCKKDGDFYERGDMPKDRKQIGEDNKERWLDVIRSAKEGTTAEEYPHEFIRYNNTIEKLYRPQLTDIDYSGTWYYGPPGSGKSRMARANYPGYYLKSHNKWWDDYNKEENVLIDDFDHNHKIMGSFLKNYVDHYPFRAEHKGGSKMIRPKNIIVTSNYSICDIFGDDAILTAALERRFKMVHVPLPSPSGRT